MTVLQRFNYINGSHTDFRVTVEPWAEQFLIRPGQRVEILVRGTDAGGVVELEQLTTGLIIFGSVGTVVTLRSDGEELQPVAQE